MNMMFGLSAIVETSPQFEGMVATNITAVKAKYVADSDFFFTTRTPNELDGELDQPR